MIRVGDGSEDSRSDPEVGVTGALWLCHTQWEAFWTAACVVGAVSVASANSLITNTLGGRFLFFQEQI